MTTQETLTTPDVTFNENMSKNFGRCMESIHLQDTEEDLRIIFETISDGILVADLIKKKFIFGNKAFCRMIDYSLEEIQNLGVSDIHPKKDLPHVLNEFEKQMKEDGRIARDIPLQKKDGTIFHADISATATLINDKPYLVGVIRDITEQKTTQLTLKKSEQRLQLALEGGEIGMWDWFVQTNEIYWGPRYLSMLGYEPNELAHTIENWIDLIHPEDRNSLQKQMINSLLKGSGRINTELRMRKKDGSYIWILGMGKVVERSQNGKPLRISGTHLEITTAKIAKQKLQQSENKFRSMMETMRDLVCICSLDYRVEYMNPALIRQLGRTADGELCYQALHDFTEPCSWCHIKKESLEKHDLHDFTSLKDNHTYQLSQAPIDNQNSSVSMMTIYRDITKFKNLEAQLSQSQKMEAIGTLAGGIAHDFNNILTSILGFSELTLLDLPESSKAGQSLTQVIASGKRARELVKQILTLSRKESQNIKILNPYVAIKEVLKMLRSSLPTTIDIVEHLDPECGEIQADPTQLHQIVMNLCTNAFHAIKDQKGTLKIKLQRVEIDSDKDTGKPTTSTGTFIVLSVSDSGCGMDQATKKRIFEPYFTTKKIGQGTGLGLAITHGIVESYNGFIEVESELGQGTTFHIYLPALEKSNVAPQQKEGRSNNLAPGSEHILIVDDEEAILNLHEALLTRLGYKITATNSSREALVLITAKPNQFDLIITDQSMPNISGAEMAHEALKIKPTMPIILCTGYSSVLSENDALAIGIKKYVQKPVSIKDLAKIVRQILDASLRKPS